MKAAITPLLLGLLLWLAPPSAQAFRFIPFTADFDPSGPGANQTFKVENNSNQQIAVEVSIFRRSMNLDGTDELTEAEDDFLVFPSQIVLEPERSQIVRVQWIGDPKPQKELAYRIIAEELPVDLEPEERSGGSVRILVRYMGSIYVRPGGARDDVVLLSAAPDAAENGERKLSITLHNRGGAHAILRNLRLSLAAETEAPGIGRALEFGSQDLAGMSGENILAEHRRRFLLPWPRELPFGPLDVTFQFDRPVGR